VNIDEGRQKYRSLNNQLRRATDKAHEKWWEKQCSELEQKSGRADKAKELETHMQVRDRHGKLLTEEEEVKCRWKKYIEELYDGTGQEAQLLLRNGISNAFLCS